MTPFLERGTLLRGRYEILREIGRGASSVVYAARDGEVGGEVAIKLLVPPPLEAERARERMRREIRVVRGLTHEGIVRIHDFLEEAGRSFLVMELVPGPDLARRLQDRGPLHPADATRLGVEVAEALSAAHRAGVLHRDIKPQNILLDPSGRARLADFGAARQEGLGTLTQSGGLVGTYLYSAPEVLEGARGDARSDLYALGLTLYHALTGRLPGPSGSHLPPPPMASGQRPSALVRGLPEWLDHAVARMTAADPGRRFATAAETAEALAEEGGPPPIPSSDRTVPLDFCLSCGATDLLGLGVCPACGGSESAEADTLVFVRPERGGDPTAASARLAASFPSPPNPKLLDAAVMGRRALVRVPREGVGRVVARLAGLGLESRAIAAGHAWSALPGSFYVLVALVVTAGLTVGVVAAPAFLVSGPLVAGGMLLVAHRAVQRPVLRAYRRSPLLPASLERRIIQVMARLPDRIGRGGARRLLADVVRVGQAVHERDPAIASQVEALLSEACEAAAELAVLEDTHDHLERHAEERRDAPARLLDAIAETNRARDRLTQGLLEAMAALAALRTRGPDDEGAGARLEPLAAEIRNHLSAREEAAREIEALLAEGSGPAGGVVPKSGGGQIPAGPSGPP